MVLTYFLPKVETADFHLCEVIRQTAALLSSQCQENNEGLPAQPRFRYIQTLACRSIATLGLDAVLAHITPGKTSASSSPDDSSHILAAAAYLGDVPLVRRLLDEGAQINPDTTYFGRPLEAAASQGHTDIVRLLLDLGAAVNDAEAAPPDRDDFVVMRSAKSRKVTATALEAASTAGHFETVRTLLEPRYMISHSGLSFKRSTYHSAKEGHIEVFRLLLESSEPAPSIRTMECITFTACSEGYTEVLRLLLDKGVDPNVRYDEEVDTPLARAADSDLAPVVRLLLERGANPLGTCNEYPLAMAARFGSFDVAEAIINHDRATLHTSRPYTPLAAAAKAGQKQMVEYLLMQGADVNIDGEDWDHKPLCFAIRGGNKAIIRILLAHGAEQCRCYRRYKGL